MLYHVKIIHDAAHCPGYQPELLPKYMEAAQNLDSTASKFGVKVHGLFNALPDHYEFLIAEAPNQAALAMFISEALPYGAADTETSAVMSLDQVLEMARAM